ncbi:holo-ACP synthase [Kitasatospora cathayae]|uniref:Holo-[acyl-carrier-protein] synthase n=1 Tax=Kitasatospora cathayae TaxID=3004092 RepID=A0ABY7PXK0_9ACTN|nr:holo-ACP synthase [Kitasatospora sp. HUAS 3-15]WBP85091.1 holo-ACP synthase [Kitasatospora sp. HUAS 3-15]
MTAAAAPGPPAGWANLGMDIVSAGRVRAMIDEHGEVFLLRMLTERELADCHTVDGLDILAVCGRIAAKEAAFKTLRVADSILPWLDIEVRRAPGGWPLIELHGRAEALAARAGISGITVSISHDVDYAVAVGAPVPVA